MRRIHTLAALCAAVMLVGALALTVQAQSDGMKIENAKALGGTKERGPVVFNHDKHTGPAAKGGYGQDKCTTCHHKFDPKDKKKNIWTEGDETSCVACHAGAKPVSAIGLQDAYHQMCWGCHDKQPTKAGAFGPRSCAGCHAVK